MSRKSIEEGYRTPSPLHDVIEFRSGDSRHTPRALYDADSYDEDDSRRNGGGGGYDNKNHDNDEVLRLAARLAPAFEEAHHVLEGIHPDAVSAIAGSTGDEHAEDDDLKREISDLEHSEALLRQELEQANFFSQMFLRKGSSGREEYDDDDEYGQEYDDSSSMESPPAVTEADMNSQDYEAPEQNLVLPPIDEEELHTRTASSASKRWPNFRQNHNSPNKNNHGSPEANNNNFINRSDGEGGDESQGSSSVDSSAAVATPASSVAQTTARSSATPSTPSTPVSPLLVMGRTPLTYSLFDHKNYLHITTENGWYLVNMNQYVLPAHLKEFSDYLPGLADFCISCPENRLKTWYLGFVESEGPQRGTWKSPLPVRTSLIRIRADVLCGAVMDAIVSATATLVNTEPDKVKDYNILRRQGGHLQLSVTSFARGTSALEESLLEQQFLVDAQLCTHKSNQCERVLLVRIFHFATLGGDGRPSPTKAAASPHSPRGRKSLEDRHQSDGSVCDTPKALLHLREACALVQRIEIETSNVTNRRPIKFRPVQSPSMSDRDAMSTTFGKHLHKTYKACPSTKEGTITLPALNSDDWQLIKTSWIWFEAIWDELESRSLTYTSLATTRFGAFPCLPTLDVHYCSQIRRYSRETMIVQLLKSATQLEEYTRDSEYACANVIALLHRTFREYGVDPPPLPVPIPLTCYPLDYVAPQSICPPWGLKVMEALNQVQVWVDKASKQTPEQGDSAVVARITDSIELSTRSVAAVLLAFQRQDDEEKGARLQRKNNQVMDRLSFMKKHQIVSVELLEQCTSDAAQKAADDLEAKTTIREVPLLKFSVVARSTTGTCIVTARHIIFVTTMVPLFGMGAAKVHVFDLQEIDFELQVNAPIVLSALPTVISLEKDGQEVFSFRPSGGGPRLKNFLDIIKSIACGSETLLSS